MTYARLAQVLITIIGTLGILMIVFFLCGCGKKTSLKSPYPQEGGVYPRTYPNE